MQDENKIFEGVKNALGIKCENCGEVNPTGTEECKYCQNPLPGDIEEKPFSYKDSSGIPVSLKDEQAYKTGMKAIPLEEAKNLNLLRETAERVENGIISMDEYRQNVSKVLNIARTGKELFKTQVFKNAIAKMDEEQKGLSLKSASLFDLYY
ncbi:MAG: hypothetical protein ACLFQV_08950 [Vulcanimicrobiota bacterium]